jgi:hypothetical protein
MNDELLETKPEFEETYEEPATCTKPGKRFNAKKAVLATAVAAVATAGITIAVVWIKGKIKAHKAKKTENAAVSEESVEE